MVTRDVLMIRSKHSGHLNEQTDSDRKDPDLFGVVNDTHNHIFPER